MAPFFLINTVPLFSAEALGKFSTDFYKINIFGKLATRLIRLYMNYRPQYQIIIEILSKFKKYFGLRPYIQTDIERICFLHF